MILLAFAAAMLLASIVGYGPLYTLIHLSACAWTSGRQG
jgi:hypothetical protein